MSEGKALLIAGLLAVVGIVVVLLAHAGGGAGGDYPLYWSLDSANANTKSASTTLDIASQPYQACLYGVTNTGSVAAELNFWIDLPNSTTPIHVIKQVPVGADGSEGVCMESSFKVTYPNTTVTVRARVDSGSVYIESIGFAVTAFPPTNLHGTSTTKSISLAWDAFGPCDPSGCGATGLLGRAYAGGIGAGTFTYNVYRSQVNSTVSNQPKLLKNTMYPSFTDTDVVQGAVYNYYVVTVDQWGTESTPSNGFITTLTPESHLPPTQLSADNIGETALTLRWLAPQSSSPISYVVHRVYFANYYDPVPTDKIIGTTTNTSLGDTGLTAGTQYWYYVVAAYPRDITAKSSVYTVTTTDTTPPSVPSGLKSTTVTSRTITIRWKQSTDNSGFVAGYIIYRDGKEIARVDSARFTNFKLQANHAYSYRVAAYDNAGNISAKSASFKAQTKPIPSNVTCGWTLHGYFQYLCKPKK